MANLLESFTEFLSTEVEPAIGRGLQTAKAGAAALTGMSEEKRMVSEKGNQLYGKETELGGKSDAFRHIVFSAMLAQKYGDLPAETLSKVNETFTWNQPESQKEMDLANDAIGRKIGKSAKSLDEIFAMAQAEIDTGKANVSGGVGGKYYDVQEVDQEKKAKEDFEEEMKKVDELTQN